MRLRLCVSVFCGLVAVLCPATRLSAQTQAPASETAKPAAPASETAKPAAPAYASDPKFQAAMTDGGHLVHHKQFSFAADSYKKASKIAGGQCLDCLRGLYDAQTGGGNYKDAAATAEAMEALATDPSSKSVAELRRASALYAAAGDKPKPDKLQAVHEILQQAVTNTPKFAAALFLDGKVLAAMGKVEEARADFTQCVSCVSAKDPARLRAQHFAENPELALHKMAPAFEVSALDGSKFNLDAMGGRVVLIDFWATWCGPCNRELPHMQKLARQFAGQPLVIISVSWDNDETKWKDFIAKNNMTWVQYRDADHKLAELFGINSIPHYFTIDSDGVLTSEMLGEGADVEGKLKKLIAKAKEAQKETVASVGATSSSGMN
jgi:thiol-disulfide isomerase/thioredoxin